MQRPGGKQLDQSSLRARETLADVFVDLKRIREGVAVYKALLNELPSSGYVSFGSQLLTV